MIFQITRAIIHHQEHRFPLALYRKYEIQSLIRALPRKISAASQLFDEIELIEESTLNSQHIEAFREVKKAVNGMEEGEEAWPVLMSLMMGFLKQDDGFVSLPLMFFSIFKIIFFRFTEPLSCY